MNEPEVTDRRSHEQDPGREMQPLQPDRVAFRRDLLEKPFPPEMIKQRKGNHGDILDYVDAPAVMRRLNDAFDGEWTYEVERFELYDREVVVLGRLYAGGVAKMQFGRSDITRDEQGKPISLGDDLKAAATDALKKAATLFGVGLHLYEEKRRTDGGAGGAKGCGSESDPPSPAASHMPRNEGRPPSQTDGRLTNKQLAMIYGLAKQKGIRQAEVVAKAKELFGKRPDHLTKREASALIDELKVIPEQGVA